MTIHVRPIDPAGREVEWVARRMRRTLVEVVGERRGSAMYSMSWLEQRVRWHMDPETCTGAVFLAESTEGALTGHVIVRRECGGVGLFSTIYAEPSARRRGVGSALLCHGEQWMRDEARGVAATHTAASNERLIGLFRRHGFAVVLEVDSMVRLEKPL